MSEAVIWLETASKNLVLSTEIVGLNIWPSPFRSDSDQMRFDFVGAKRDDGGDVVFATFDTEAEARKARVDMLKVLNSQGRPQLVVTVSSDGAVTLYHPGRKPSKS